MEKIRFLKMLGISLFLFVSLFFIANRSLAEKPWIELGDIDESADDAQFIRWEIKAEKAYDVVVYMEDDDGNEFSIVFRTRDDENDYYTPDNDRLVVGIGKEDDYYFDGNSKRIYESKSFTDLTSKHSSENSNITYNFDDDTTINTIRIYGEDFRLYSIALADTDYFDNLCWEREALDWINLWSFENDNGTISNDTSIAFSSSSIHVTEKETSSYFPVYGGIYGGIYGGGLYGMYGIGGFYGSSLYGGYGGSGYSGWSSPTYGSYGGLGGLGYSRMYGNYGPGWGGPPYGTYNSYSSGSGYTPPFPYYQSSYPVTNINPYVNPYPSTVGRHYYGPWNSGGFSGWGYSGWSSPPYGNYSPGWGYSGWGNWY